MRTGAAKAIRSYSGRSDYECRVQGVSVQVTSVEYTVSVQVTSVGCTVCQYRVRV